MGNGEAVCVRRCRHWPRRGHWHRSGGGNPEDRQARSRQVGSETPLEEVARGGRAPAHALLQDPGSDQASARIILVQGREREERGRQGCRRSPPIFQLAGPATPLLMPNTGRGGGHLAQKSPSRWTGKRLKAIAHELEGAGEGMGPHHPHGRPPPATKQGDQARTSEYEDPPCWENVRELDVDIDGALPRVRGRQPHQGARSATLYSKDIEDILVAGEPAFKESLRFHGACCRRDRFKSVIKYEAPEPLFSRLPDRAAS